MRDSTFSKIADKAAPFLDADETVRHAVPGFEGPRAALLFGLLGSLFINPYIVVATDRRVYLLHAGRFATRTPKGLTEKHDIGEVVLELDRSVPFNRLTLRSTSNQTGRTLWVAKLYRKDAEAAIDALGPSRP
jgi:hypothetical protein